MIDLDAEFLACRRPSGLALSRLKAEGVTLDYFALYQLIAAARIRVDGHLFDFDDQGAPAYITPVRVSPGNYTEEFESTGAELVPLLGDVIDLAAWHPDAANRFALRTGNARVLGAVEPQMMEPAPVPIRRTVANWMRSGGVGLVLLTADKREQGNILRSIDCIIAEDAQHAAELRRIASAPWPVPTIVAARRQAVAA